jgi:hypothetical protein
MLPAPDRERSSFGRGAAGCLLRLVLLIVFLLIMLAGALLLTGRALL